MSVIRPVATTDSSPGQLRKQKSNNNSLTKDNQADNNSASSSNISSFSRASRRGSRRKKPKAVKQDFDAIKNAYKHNAQLFEGMNFSDQRFGWGSVACEFILQPKNERFRKFVKEVHGEKVAVEKKMRQELEDRIFKMKE